MEADGGDDDEKGDEMGTYTPSQIDIDAIASAKSLGDAMRLLAPQLEGLPRRSRGKYGKRKHLTPEEKAELTRRRNRENARSTRMRRKMYIKHLQQVAETLKERHDELNTKMAAPPPDGYTRRRDAVRRFLEMRGQGLSDADDWRDVLADGFVLTLPPTPYRDFGEADLLEPSVRTVAGVEAVMADVASVHHLLESIAAARADFTAPPKKRGLQAPETKKQKRQLASRPATLRYEVDPGSIVHVGDVYMCAYVATVAVLEDGGVTSSPHNGMLKCCFSPDHKLASVHMRFDVMAVITGLEDLKGAPHPPAS